MFLPSHTPRPTPNSLIPRAPPAFTPPKPLTPPRTLIAEENALSSTAVHHISPASPPFEVGNLSPIQVQVVAALAEGRSVTRTAAAAGIHRTTIHNWMRSSKEFRDAVNEARDHFFECVNDQLNELSTVALDTLRQLLTGPDTPPSVRLHAALAVLERPSHRDSAWQVPEPVGKVMEPRREPVVLEPEPPAPQVSASAPRNAPCPCGSGLKYKYCCGSPWARPSTSSPLHHARKADERNDRQRRFCDRRRATSNKAHRDRASIQRSSRERQALLCQHITIWTATGSGPNKPYY